MSDNTVSIELHLEVDNGDRDELIDQLIARLEYVVGNEFGDPTVRNSYRAGRDWANGISGYTGALVRNVNMRSED